MGEKGNYDFYLKPVGSSYEKNVSISQWILCSSGKSYFRYDLLLNRILKSCNSGQISTTMGLVKVLLWECFPLLCTEYTMNFYLCFLFPIYFLTLVSTLSSTG